LKLDLGQEFYLYFFCICPGSYRANTYCYSSFHVLEQWFSNSLALCTFLQISSVSNRRQLYSHLLFLFSSYSVLFFIKYIKKICLTDKEVGKRKSILIALSDYYRYSSLILNQHLASVASLASEKHFLKFSCSVGFETFVICYVKIHWPTLHFEWIFYPYIIL